MNAFSVDYAKYSETARLAAAEGAVLLRNENETLPLRKTDRVSVFGRTQLSWYKSGTGSGGMVNVKYASGIIDGLQDNKTALNYTLLNTYKSWVATHPFFKGEGWGKEPWSQEEMPLTDELVAQAAASSDVAVVVIGRTAGEDQDNKNERGSYLLTDIEEDMISRVCKAFSRVAVVLNVGNIIDMKWVETYKPGAVLYAWHGGQEGGNAIADVLTGRVNPCGKLADTVAYDASDYPCDKNFGGDREAVYAEDIYVGYRYFETVALEKVLYPFGFGLSYTTFSTEMTSFEIDTPYTFHIKVRVTNTGSVPGKHVVQAYIEAPQGNLGKPARVLAAYAKTDVLMPGGSQTRTLYIPGWRFVSYDDGGVTGNKSCYVLEAGEYSISIGDDVRSADRTLNFTLPETIVSERLTSALAPVKPFMRMVPLEQNGAFVMTDEDVPLRAYDVADRIAEELPPERVCTGDRGIKLIDVYSGVATLTMFVDQIPDETLACLVRGEGMNSLKVTNGAAGAFGGLTDELRAFGIPAACCTDGPSGMRMDNGAIAFSLPNGTCLACTWNDDLAEELFTHVGREMRRNRVDVLLGPGVNIHRSPLGGRNFEYFSEDPLLTGKMAAAELRGLSKSNVTGTLKHFTANNQEHHRFMIDCVISERALREIYLKGYEIAVREGGMMCVMTTYGMVNGLFTAGSYDLTTTILRGEWDYEGLAMTDWWATTAVDANGMPSRTDRAAMVRAQNDLFMVTQDTNAENANDNILASLQDGTLTRAELCRNAENILDVILRTNAAPRGFGLLTAEELEASEQSARENGVRF